MDDGSERKSATRESERLATPPSSSADPPLDRLTVQVLHACDAVGAFVEYWGFKAIHGRIWTLLALRSEPMAQSEIADVLSVSKSLVSTAVAELVKFGLVRPTDDHRNAPYEASMDIWPVVSDVLRSREWMLLESARVALDAVIEETKVMAKTGRSAVPFNPERMKLLLNMTETAQNLLKILIAIRLPAPMRGFASWIGKAADIIQRFGQQK